MFTRNQRLTAVVASLAIIAGACGGDDDSSDPPPSTDDATDTTDAPDAPDTTDAPDATDAPLEQLDLSVGVYPGAFLNIGEYVAVEEGMFESHGLDVDLVDIPSGPEQIAALVSNSIDVMGNTPANFLIANAQGQEMVGLLGAINSSFYTWVAQTDWPLPNAGAAYPESVLDMEGATIGVTGRGAEVELFTRALLEDAGLDPERDVTFVAVGAGAAAIGAFQAGQIDILVAFEPSQTLLIDVEGQGVSVLDLRAGEGPDIFNNFVGQMRGVLRSEAEANPEPFTRYQAAMAEAYEFIGDEGNRERVVEIYGTYLDFEPEVLELIIENNAQILGPTIDCDAYQNVVDFVVTSGQLTEDEITTPDCESFMWEGAQPFMINQ